MRAATFCWKNINNFEQAKTRYESIKPKKFKLEDLKEAYGDDCRPLDRRYQHWKYITKGEQNGVEFYDCVFYRSPMLRFYADGRIVVAPEGLPTHFHTMSSSQFLEATLPHKFSCWREANRLVIAANLNQPDWNAAEYRRDEQRETYNATTKETVMRTVSVYDHAAYYKDLKAQRVKCVVPIDGSSLELDAKGNGTVEIRGRVVPSIGFKFKEGEHERQQAYRLVLNRSVTKLHRKEIEPMIEQAYALAAIMDGNDMQNRSGWDEKEEGHLFESAAGILYWMSLEFSRGLWTRSEAEAPYDYVRRFSMPDRKAFNDKFYPQFYYYKEQRRVDVEDIEKSAFVVKPFGGGDVLHTSQRWYKLHAQDPRLQTYPNIF